MAEANDEYENDNDEKDENDVGNEKWDEDMEHEEYDEEGKRKL
jgi:hypothetical protein